MGRYTDNQKQGQWQKLLPADRTADRRAVREMRTDGKRYKEMRLAETLIVAVIVAVLIIMQIKALKTVMDNKVTPIVEAAEECNSKMVELQDLLDGGLYD